MTKSSTTYSFITGTRDNPRSFYITVNHGAGIPHISIHENEPCEGILKHWGSPENLIAELESIIKAVQRVQGVMEEVK